MKTFLFLFIFIFLFINIGFVSADVTNINLIDTQVIPRFTIAQLSYGAGQSWSLDGNQLIICGRYYNNQCEQFYSPTPFSISSLVNNYNGSLNLTPSLDYFTTSISVGYTSVGLGIEQNDLYMAFKNIHKSNNGIITHYVMNNFNISSAYFNGEIINTSLDEITGLYITGAGDKIFALGNNVTDSRYYIQSYSLTSPFNLSTSVYNGKRQLNASTFYFSPLGDAFWTLYSNQKITEYSTLNFDISNLTISSNASLGGTIGQTYYAMTMYFAYNTNYLYDYSQGGQIFQEWSFSPTILLNQSKLNPALLNGTINPLVNLFPDAETLTIGQKFAFVFITMLVIAGIILFAGGSVGGGVHPILLWILLILEVMTYFFFTAIHYLSIGLLVMIALIALAVVFFLMRGGNKK